MRRYIVFVLVCATVLAFSAGCDDVEPAIETLEAPVPAAPDPATLLTPADVEQVSGLSGLSVVPYDPAVGAGGDVNIADASGQLVAMLVVEGPETWGLWLTDGFTVREPVTPPVGDESFIGPSLDVSEAVYIFGFIKGETAVVIDTFLDPAGNGTILSSEELRELAEIVESRL